MTERADLELVAENAAAKTMRSVFRLFGVDIDDQDSVNAFRDDLVHAHKLRKVYEQSTTWALRVVVTSVAGAALLWLWHGLKDSFTR